MKKMSFKGLLTLILVLVTIAFNILANALPLNGISTGQVSDSIKSLFVPAGYVFAIWGVIYLGLIAFAVYQILPSHQNSAVLTSIQPWVWLSCVANMAWLFLWHYQRLVLTVPVMIVLLIALIIIFISMNRQRGTVTRSEMWAVRIPFSIYLGWISVATIANISSMLVYLNWDGFGVSPEIWTVTMLAVATLLGLLMIIRHKDYAYLSVLIWAFVGIWVKQSDHPLVAMAAALAAIVATIIAIYFLFRKQTHIKEQTL